MDFRPILYVIGVLLSVLSVSMVLPMLADFYFDHDDWQNFFACIIVTAFFGGCLIIANRMDEFNITSRQTFILTTLSWLVMAGFGALPFYLSKMDMSLTDSYFEAMSGITTTGSTVMTGLDYAPAGILLWRSILQWLGGIGIIIMALSVLPFLKVGGMQIFRIELSEGDKAMPRVTNLASSIAIIYVALTIICAMFYQMTGWDFFTSICHALTTISTGGFSTFDSSFNGHDTAMREIICITFMLIGGMPFVLYLKLLQGNSTPLIKDPQVRGFLAMVLLTVSAISLYNYINLDEDLFDTIVHAAFSVVSTITGTGYVNTDYGQWNPFPVAIIFFLMAMGGCAGSTSCGIKIFRFQVLYSVAVVQIKKLLHPHGVFAANYHGKPVTTDVALSVMSFFFVYALTFALLSALLAFTGLGFIESISGALTAISNVGPGLGSIGPAETFTNLPDSSKWILSFGMMVGRLELFTILVLFSPYFWKR